MRREGEHGERSRPCLLQLALERNGNPSKMPFTCLHIVNENEILGDESMAGCTAGFRGTFRNSELHIWPYKFIWQSEKLRHGHS